MRPVVVGAMIGAGVSAVFALGETSAATGYGNSLALFALSLPWSALTMALGAPIVALLGLPERVAAHGLVYTMPVVSGAVWGALYQLVRAVVAGNRAARARRRG